MQKRMPIYVALAAGLLAAYLTSAYIDEIRASASPPATQVLVAVRDLRAGTVLEPTDVAASWRYTQGLPKFAVPWNERNLYIGQPLRIRVAEADFILASYFGGSEQEASRLSERLDVKRGERAVTIPVSRETSLEGSIRPGDRIDLLLTYQAPTGGEKRGAGLITAPLLQNAFVLATGAFESKPGEPYSSITLLLGAEEAKLLVWARNLGDLSILLRNPKDVSGGERTFLAGDTMALQSLGGREVSVAEAISSVTRGGGAP